MVAIGIGDTLRHLRPPENLTVEEWWLGIKTARRTNQRILPIIDADGGPFTYLVPDEAEELLRLGNPLARSRRGVPVGDRFERRVGGLLKVPKKAIKEAEEREKRPHASRSGLAETVPRFLGLVRPPRLLTSGGSMALSWAAHPQQARQAGG